MASDKPVRYRLTPKAIDDLDSLWRYSAETWSLDQADRLVDGFERCFSTLVAMPELARERPEFSPPVRIHAHDRHLIVYVLQDDHILVLRLLSGRQNWHALLTTLDS